MAILPVSYGVVMVYFTLWISNSIEYLIIAKKQPEKLSTTATAIRITIKFIFLYVPFFSPSELHAMVLLFFHNSQFT